MLLYVLVPQMNNDLPKPKNLKPHVVVDSTCISGWVKTIVIVVFGCAFRDKNIYCSHITSYMQAHGITNRELNTFLDY